MYRDRGRSVYSSLCSSVKITLLQNTNAIEAPGLCSDKGSFFQIQTQGRADGWRAVPNRAFRGTTECVITGLDTVLVEMAWRGGGGL